MFRRQLFLSLMMIKLLIAIPRPRHKKKTLGIVLEIHANALRIFPS